MNHLGKYLVAEEIHFYVMKEVSHIETYYNAHNRFALTADEIKEKIGQCSLPDSDKKRF